MAGKVGASHRFEALGQKARREKVAKVIARTEGNLVKAAHQLGVARSWLYTMVTRDQLWPVVNAARERRLEDLRAAAALDRTAKSWEVKKKWRWYYGRKKGQVGKP